MLLAPNDSPYDLRFSFAGTPVRVHVSFWIFTAILGWNKLHDGIPFLLAWIVCVFFSILLHEFGHIWAGRVFGSDGHVVLYSFGGLAIGSNDLRPRWQRVTVSLSGPGIQFLLFGVLLAITRYVIRSTLADWDELPVGQRQLWQSLVLSGLSDLLFINLIWPLFNLLPVWPLDGGMVTREFCEWINAREGLRMSLGVSTAVAGFIAVNHLLCTNNMPHVPYVCWGGIYTIILFALLAVESFMLLQQISRGPRFDDRSPWEM